MRPSERDALFRAAMRQQLAERRSRHQPIGEVTPHGTVEFYGTPKPRLRTAYDLDRDLTRHDRCFLFALGITSGLTQDAYPMHTDAY